MGVPHGGKGVEQETEKEKFKEGGTLYVSSSLIPPCSANFLLLVV